MADLSELYSTVPPTKLRNIDEKFCPANTSEFWLGVADFFFYRMLRSRFYAFHYKGAEKFFNRDASVPVIMFAPHSNWWDGIVGYTICNAICKKQIRLMVEELKRFPLLRRAGAFSVNKKSPQASMEAIKYAIDTLGSLESNLYLFPQGIIKPPNFRPLEFQSGLAYIADKASKKYGKVALMPIAVNFVFLRDNRPEVLVEMGDLIELTSEQNIDRKQYSKYLSKVLENLCDKQLQDIRHAEFYGYETLFRQKLKWYRRIEQRLKKIDLPSSGV